MKILRSWLQDHIDIDSSKLSDDEIADKLALSGTAVEEVTNFLDEKIIVAEIIKIEPHPNADRLQLATVTDGTNETKVVCGAPNIQVGQKVPFAQLGAMLPGNFEIKKANIRGVESLGMLCAADELALGDDHAGIIILPEDCEIGVSISKILHGDSIFDLEITANRGDCLSHLGIARELRAVLDLPLKENLLPLPIQSDTPKLSVSIDINSGVEGCYRYSCIGINNITIAPSSDLIQSRLSALGLKPINNIVDASNYTMIDMGHPTHAFDADKIEGGQIIVRFAKNNEEIITLDGIKRVLNDSDLVIADQKKILALAGIMGCENSIVDSNTKNIIIESAHFNPITIRMTAKRLGLSTDASYRYERGIDRNGPDAAIDQVAARIIISAGGEYTEGLSAIVNDLKPIEIAIPYDLIRGLIGIDISDTHINDILVRLGFQIIDEHIAAVPLWRNDVTIWQDLAEEIARIYGYNNIPRVALPISDAPQKASYYQKEFIKDTLVDLGFSEVFGYTFLSENNLKTIGLSPDSLLEVKNPIQIENRYMKSSLLPSLLKAVAKNPTFDPIMIFEIGNVFTKETEKSHLAIVTSGKNAKKIIEEAQKALSSQLQIDTELLPISELSRDELQRYKIKKPITYMIEVDLELILSRADLPEDRLKLNISDKKIKYRGVSKFPAITRDLAFIIDNKLSTEDMITEIYDISELIGRVELFDEFVSDKFGKNKKNVAYHIYLEHPERTLIDNEADLVIQKIIEMVKSKYAGELRDK
ncbi:MAG: phenylalanine--tRNA ligase subunit beta [bacterium]